MIFATGGYYHVELAGRRLQLIGLNTPIWSQVNRSESREEETHGNVVLKQLTGGRF
jgi:hypothetical protein